jgi:hypothetical protein
VSKGYTVSDLKKCVDKYARMDVLIFDEEGDLITLV